jgi:antiphage defense system Thoeris ThsB-like protein
MSISQPFDIESFLGILPSPKRKIFVSYHHAGDQYYYGLFKNAYSEQYEVVYDNSLNRQIDSDNINYVIQRIRDEYISGSSCTIVLCGAETRWRKYVDWEIKATLDKQHGLLGVRLPTTPINSQGSWYKPDRLQDNLVSGYGIWTTWENLSRGGVSFLRDLIEKARAKSIALIKNDRPMMSRNGVPPWKR